MAAISYKQAQTILARLPLRRTTRPGDISAVHGSVLAGVVRAKADSPDFTRALMDGFAVRGRDTGAGAVVRVVGFAPAGRVFRGRVEPGTCVRIATGAPLPRGADAVIKLEDTRSVPGGCVACLSSVSAGANRTLRGAYFRAGTVLVEPGTRLGAAHIALLASQGVRRVRVYKEPRVGLLATGDEIVEPGRKKTPGRIWNASAPMLLSALSSLGIAPAYLGCVRDEPAQIGRRLRRGLAYDILIVTGAVSVGERDFVPGVLKQLGVRTLFHKVRIRPGKPVFLGRRGRCVVFGLPGNAVSSLTTFHLFVRPVVRRLMGLEGGTLFETGPLAAPAENASGRLSFLPGRLKTRGGRTWIAPLPFCDSSDLRAAAAAQVFYALRETQIKAAKGTTVPFFRIPR
ncbi:MAG: molybdopterin molybdotransferase MoeA [Deltaproteobacteria bacterium]